MHTNHIKKASTKFPVIDTITNRFSPRAFSDRPLTHDDLHTLIEAASWAPSAINEQPWRYLAAMKGTEGFDKMLACLAPANAGWAKNAAALVLSYAKLNYSSNGTPNVAALHDTGLANANLLTQATAMHIYGHMMGGYNAQTARDTFQISDDYQPVCIIALGYLGDAQMLEEPFLGRELTPRSRKPLEEVVAWV